MGHTNQFIIAESIEGFMDPVLTATWLVNGLECALMRQTFLELQKDENASNEVLMKDVKNWEKYLDAYVIAYNIIKKPMIQ